MADKDAKVTIGVDGADEVARAADRALRPWTNAAGHAKSAVQGMGQAFADTVRQTASDVARGVTAFAAFDLSSRIPAVIQYREEVARLSVVAGQSAESLRTKFAAQEAQTLQSRQANEEFAKSFGRITYGYKDAADAAAALSAEALASARSLGEMAGVGKVIYDATQKISAAPEVLGRIRAAADMLKTTGGPDALRDQFEALGGVIARMSVQTPEQLGRFAGAIGAIGKGLRPDQAKEAQQSITSKVFGDTRATERFLRSAGELKRGESILDESGQIKDAAGTLAAYQRAWRKQAGSMGEAKRLSRMYFGDIGGAAFMRTQFEDSEGAGVSTGAQDAAGALLGGEEGRRKAAELATRGAQGDVAAKMLPGVDAVLGFARDNPILAGAGALLAPGLAAKGLGAGMGWLGGALGFGGAGGAAGAAGAGALATGGGGAAAGGGSLLAAAEGGWLTGGAGSLLSSTGAVAAGAAPGIGAALALGQIVGTGQLLGEDRDAMGRKYRTSHGGVETLEAYGKAMRAASGVDAADAPLVAYKAARSAGASPEDAEEIARRTAEKFNLKVTIINQTGGPIEAINEQNADAAGAQ